MPITVESSSLSLNDGQQPSVWGLVTNGRNYLFVYLRQGNPLIYQLMPELSLINTEDSIRLWQVMKAICQLESFQFPRS